MAEAALKKDGSVVVTWAEDEVDAFLHATRGGILHDAYQAVKTLVDEAETAATTEA